jgi:drug/metabolite transporter (DMT)-like permease
MLVGLVAALPFAAAAGVPHGLHGLRIAWFLAAGLGNVVGLLLAYSAMRLGKVSIIAPITSTEGAIAAVLAVVAGETLGLASALALAVVAGGVVLASRVRDDGRADHPPRATLLAVAAAGSFGIGLYATGRVSAVLPVAWAMLPPRVVGVAVVSLPALARRRLAIPRAMLPYVTLTGLCEVVGFASYAAGSRHSIAISAVLASQFATLTAIAAYLLFHERLTRVQATGVAVVLAGVAALSALQA